MLRHLSGLSSETVSGTGFFRGQFDGWDVAVAETGAGNVSAAAITARACEHYQPQAALFIGVAGGSRMSPSAMLWSRPRFMDTNPVKTRRPGYSLAPQCCRVPMRSNNVPASCGKRRIGGRASTQASGTKNPPSTSSPSQRAKRSSRPNVQPQRNGFASNTATHWRSRWKAAGSWKVSMSITQSRAALFAGFQTCCPERGMRTGLDRRIARPTRPAP